MPFPRSRSTLPSPLPAAFRRQDPDLARFHRGLLRLKAVPGPQESKKGAIRVTHKGATQTAVVVKTHGIPIWGRRTPHFRTYFSGDWDVHSGYGPSPYGVLPQICGGAVKNEYAFWAMVYVGPAKGVHMDNPTCGPSCQEGFLSASAVGLPVRTQIVDAPVSAASVLPWLKRCSASFPPPDHSRG